MVFRCRNCDATLIFHADGYTIRKINSQAYITKTHYETMPLPMRTLVLKWNFAPVQLSDNFEPHWIGPYEVLDRICDVLTFSQDGSTFHTHRTHTTPYYSKSLPYPHLQNFRRFSDSINFDTSKTIKSANSDSYTFNTADSSSDDASSPNLKNICHYQNLFHITHQKL